MHRNPLLHFHRSAEAGGYPALLIVAMISLGLVVAPVALLAMTQAVWMLGVAVLSIGFALAILAAGIQAAFGDNDEPAGQPEDAWRAPEARHERRNRQAA